MMFFFILYGKCEPGQVEYQQDSRMNKQGNCCRIGNLGVISEKLATSVLFPDISPSL